MFARKKDTYVDKEIARTVLALADVEPKSEEYGAILEKLSKLQKIRQEEKPDQISKDTLAQVATNLLGIAIIVRHENLNVIASKAVSFVSKVK